MVRNKKWGKDFDNTPKVWQIICVLIFIIVMSVLIWQFIGIVPAATPYRQDSTKTEFENCVERVKHDMKKIGSTTPIEIIEKGCRISTQNNDYDKPGRMNTIMLLATDEPYKGDSLPMEDLNGIIAHSSHGPNYSIIRIASEMERWRCRPFRRALDKRDRKIFDEMFDISKYYNVAGTLACRPVLSHVILMSIIFEHYKQLTKLATNKSESL